MSSHIAQLKTHTVFQHAPVYMYRNLSLHQGGVVMSSQITQLNTHTVFKCRHPIAYISTLHLHLDFHKVPHLTVYPNRIMLPFVTASHPSPGDNHQCTGGWSERTLGQAKMAK